MPGGEYATYVEDDSVDELVVAVDPGRDKCGVAVVDRCQGVKERFIAATSDLPVIVTRLVVQYGSRTVVVGDRTTSGAAQGVLRAALSDRSVQILAVDEHRSTEEARARYWRENPPRGLRRLVPVTMLAPPRPVDDYVAVILAERYWEGRKAESREW